MRNRIVAVLAVAVCALVAGCANTVAGTGSPGPATAGGPVGQSQSAPSPIAVGSPGLPSTDTGMTPEPPTSDPASPASPASPDSAAPATSPPAPQTAPQTSAPDPGPATVASGNTGPDTSQPTDTGEPAETGAATPVDPADFPGTVTEFGFQSPTGNIRCGISENTAVCQIGDYSYTPPAGDCGDSGWGFNFRVSPGKPAELFCAGDVEGGGPTLDYGRVLTVDDVSCASAEQGITCRNTATGNGFRLSKAEYSLFTADGDWAPAPAGGTSAPAGMPTTITGDWSGHGRGLALSEDGHGILDYRTYRFCSDDPTPPCDRIDGSMITPGGHIEFILDAPAGDASASGTVTDSNDPTTAAGSPITATVTDGLLELSIWPDTPFCGSDSPPGACGA